MIKGSTIAQLVPILATPILTRIYTKEDFGLYGYFLAIISIITPILSLRYDKAIVLSKSENELNSLVKLSSILTILISFTIVIAVGIFVYFSSTSTYKYYILFAFIILIISGISNISLAILNYSRDYNYMSKNLIYNSSLNSILCIIFGVFNPVTISMITGLLFSKLIALIIIFKKAKKYITLKGETNLKISSIKFADFPMYSAPEALIGGVGTHLNLLFIGIYSQGFAGAYFLVNRLAAVPISILSNSYSSVFFKDYSIVENKRQYLKKCWIKVFILSFIPFILIYLLSPYLLDKILGNDWALCSEILVIMIPYFWINFIFGCTSTSHIVLRLQNISLVFSIVSITFKSSLYFYALNNNLGFLEVLKYITSYDIFAIILMNMIAYMKA